MVIEEHIFVCFKHFAMGAAESSQIVNYDIFQRDDCFANPFEWELHHAKSKLDGSRVSIFRTNVKSASSSNAYALNCFANV